MLTENLHQHMLALQWASELAGRHAARLSFKTEYACFYTNIDG